MADMLDQAQAESFSNLVESKTHQHIKRPLMKPRSCGLFNAD